ncbi:MAG: hypothetical protein ACTSO7_18825 [Candidatus Heimdallarchaeota archaeon]
MTELLEESADNPKFHRIQTAIISIAIGNFLLSFLAVFFVIFTPLFSWSSAGMLQVIDPFGLLDFNSNPSWFNRDIIILIALFSICVIVSYVSLLQSKGKLSFPKLNLLFFLLNLHLSISILVLILLTRKAFLVFSSLENPLGRVYNSIAFISTLIFVSIFLLLSCSKFLLSFWLVRKKNII